MKNLITRLTEVMRRQEMVLSAIALSLFIFIIWSWLYNILSVSAWKTPIGYEGDAWLNFATAKAYMSGDIYPIFFKMVNMLNAPFSGNWNDYPVTEDFLYAGMGWLGKFIGLYAAANFMLLLAHLMAGLSFWFVCRELKYKPIFSFSGALVYSFCHFIIARGLGHIVLTFFWHIPLLLLISQWVYSKEIINFKTRKFLFAVIVSVMCGILNPYYTGMFLQFLGFGVVLHLARKQYSNVRFPLALIFVTSAAFALVNADTIIFNIINGTNLQAAGRNLAALEVYGLKIPELVFAPGYHPLRVFEAFSQKHYYSQSYVKGEFWSPYLGFVALAGIILLCVTSMYRFLQGRFECISIQFWYVVWILLYSLIGGINLLIGSFGFVLFRGTNRYSIFILTIGLLFAVRYLSRKCPKVLVIPMALLITTIGLSEELAGRFLKPPSSINPIVEIVNADRNFAQMVERQVPDSMVFQLPVAGFPEVGPINRMGDYEHFRPFLYTKTLHYSYGTNKGRGDTEWQAQVAKLSPSDMASKLESYGFAVVMINRKGYVDEGKFLIRGLTAAGKPVIAENIDMVAIRLQPVSSPEPIDAWPRFGAGWSEDEVTHRWSESSHSKMMFTNYERRPASYVLSFGLAALTPRLVKISVNGEVLREVNLTTAGAEIQFPSTRIVLPPGLTTISFDTDALPISPGNGDSRMLSFKLSSFNFTPVKK